ncbi:MAG: hypothetical protein EZS26_000282 [Candidatus Ordinivivax streblomastigis]|uniref:Uncharacterized protein n=1 Tax=Candidatus Ordinivivax streblomastigis TaxID=2540710 RepID=A0A5M8P5M8_9BACT|nr:MAG: hypothetical protein EZS26_000282 [Candidatus Ordinivivax streblomastigis]
MQIKWKELVIGNMKIFWNFLYAICRKISNIVPRLAIINYKNKFGYCAKDVKIAYPILCTKPENVFLYENTNIWADSKFIISSAKFIMKKNVDAAQGLTVVTGNHKSLPGFWYKDLTGKLI